GFAVSAAGLPPFTVINLFNTQPGGVKNIGGLAGGTPVIPLTVSSSTRFTFSLSGTGAVPGPSYVQVLNPPFLPFTSSDNTPKGAFTAQPCGATPTASPTPSPTGTPRPSATVSPRATPTHTAGAATPTPTSVPTPLIPNINQFYPALQ